MIWVLKACVGFSAFFGACGHYIIQPYETEAQCIKAVEMLERRKVIDWVLCYPEKKP